jgi:hypothetical protein
MASGNGKSLEVVGNTRNLGIVVSNSAGGSDIEGDERSLNSVSSIDLHSTKVAHYESIHLPNQPVSPLNMVISRAPSSQAEASDWPDMSLDSSSINPTDSGFNFAALEIRGKTPLTTSSIRSDGVFEHRKGRPLSNRGFLLQTLPETIKIRGRENADVPDGELMYVSKFTLASKKSKASTMTPGVLNQVNVNHPW